ncbi:restriction endonuclease [Bacillus cereus]|uniref:DUF3427 domain-containing protein n=1 Tax=Bacillus cereus TaxID=1396 RepID=UPI000BF3FDDF|nr:DUF3427 domain-containing protein [Bacillus cereus]PFF10701.1 restriction endonuclease [Bacillus cereus]PGN30290.1 restriction endonuclease [Bacillus cereus]PGN92762.1 restriction endonuclease [Bacillus cereus]
MSLPFIVGNHYTRKDVYHIIGVPKANQEGIWNTGYTVYNNEVFIFVNLSTAGTTGHNYPNQFIGKDLNWFSKNNHSLRTKSLQYMLNTEERIYIFTRENVKNPFTFQGLGKVKSAKDTQPANIVWQFINEGGESLVTLAGEVMGQEEFMEGTTKTITVNIFERNPIARRKCIEYYGLSCVVCNFNFYEAYGDIGKDFIHVHHIVELSSIRQGYAINPIRDLRPVCPNCHAMLHRKKPAYSIESLQKKINN